MKGYYSPYLDGSKRCSWTRGAHRCDGKTVVTILQENSDIGKLKGAYGMCEWHALHAWEEKPIALPV